MSACTRYRRLLYLYREGERSSKQTARLERHLARCPRCREEAARLTEADEAFVVFRRQPAVPANPDALADAILARLTVEQARRHWRAVDRTPAFFEWRVVRAACTAAIVLIVTGFAVESFGLFRGISALETDRTLRSESRLEFAYVVSREDVHALLPDGALPPPLTGVRDGDAVRVPFSTVEALDKMPRQQFALRFANLLHTSTSADDLLRRAIRIEIAGIVLHFRNSGV